MFAVCFVLRFILSCTERIAQAQFACTQNPWCPSLSDIGALIFSQNFCFIFGPHSQLAACLSGTKEGLSGGCGRPGAVAGPLLLPFLIEVCHGTGPWTPEQGT